MSHVTIIITQGPPAGRCVIRIKTDASNEEKNLSIGNLQFLHIYLCEVTPHQLNKFR